MRDPPAGSAGRLLEGWLPEPGPAPALWELNSALWRVWKRPGTSGESGFGRHLGHSFASPGSRDGEALC